MITEEAMLEAAANILVVCDLLDDVINEADSHTIEQAVVVRHTIAEVITKAKEAIAALDVHLTSEMELYEPVQFKGWEFTNVRKAEKTRFAHGTIAGRVQKLAVTAGTDDNGETSPLEAVRHAVEMMRRIYLSDSTGAKVGELKRLGIDIADVRTKTYGDKEIRSSPLQAGDQETRGV